MERELQAVLVPSTKTAQGDLQELLRTRTVVAQATTLQATITALQERLTAVQTAQAQRVSRPDKLSRWSMAEVE